MGGPEMAPHTPPALGAPRRSRGAPRLTGEVVVREVAPDTSAALGAQRGSRGAPRLTGEVVAREVAPDTSAALGAQWGSRGAPRRSACAGAVGTRLRLAVTARRPSSLSSYSRIVSNWNLHPTGVSALTALKPDMVS
jgi:hypothetical protein